MRNYSELFGGTLDRWGYLVVASGLQVQSPLTAKKFAAVWFILQVQSPLAAKKIVAIWFILQVQIPLHIHFATLASRLCTSFCGWPLFPHVPLSLQ